MKAAVYNPRKNLKPGDKDYDKLKKSIIEFDYIDPVIWNKRSGNIVGGHQRLKILKAQGLTEIDVSVVDLDDVKEKALNLALNKTGGDWNLPKLSDLLLELDVGDIDIEITGFDNDELESLLVDKVTTEKIFEPTTAPECGCKEVTDEMIEKRANELIEKMKKEKSMESVLCPECGHEFFIAG